MAVRSWQAGGQCTATAPPTQSGAEKHDYPYA
jgi:hypothetical protein